MPHRLNPDAAAATMRAAGLEPLIPYPGARAKWLCRCTTCDREVSPQFADVRAGHGCKWCGYKATTLAQRMSHEAASAVMVEHGIEPLDPYPGAAPRWRCRCMRCGVEIFPRYTNVKAGQGGCRACAGVATGARCRRSEADAVAAMRSSGFEPLEPYRNSMSPWRCRCVACGNETSPRLNSISKGVRCKWCARNAVDPEAASVVMRAAGLDPLIDYPGAHTPWPCRCQACGQSVSPYYNSVRKGGGCRYCNDTAISPASAVAAMRAVGLDPLEPYPGSNRDWACRCSKCGRSVKPRYSTVARGMGGCRWCRNSGFKVDDVAVVYLISHAGFGSLKIGITGTSDIRLTHHRRHGWDVLAVVTVPGRRAIEIERAILVEWRTGLGLPPHLSKSEMPRGGWTETVDADAVDVPASVARIRSLAAESEQVGA